LVKIFNCCTPHISATTLENPHINLGTKFLSVEFTETRALLLINLIQPAMGLIIGYLVAGSIDLRLLNFKISSMSIDIMLFRVLPVSRLSRMVRMVSGLGFQICTPILNGL
jgi:hypothetical protein